MNRRTILMLTATTLGLAIATALPRVGCAQSNPFNPWIGTWKTNIAKSTFSPGAPPRSQIATGEVDGQGYTLTIETINAQGNPAKLVVKHPNDGKFHPVTGNPNYDAQAEKLVNDSTDWIIRTKAGKVVTTIISEVSADGKTFTDTVAGVNATGQPIYNVVVREKQ